ncbi:SH3 domain-containing protein (plasmid) [Embleya sp. NBC_00888]|uniref:SH3 domain-containing protein n=1 Tax=Embleya sp. NBC_00888 TaxID=2975960 RepID=UPI00386AD16C|nr:SH3 domain-containing protein [Embleya sp. NBC_00888]
MSDVPPGYVRVRSHLRRKPRPRPAVSDGGDGFSFGGMATFGGIALVVVVGGCSLLNAGDDKPDTESAAKSAVTASTAPTSAATPPGTPAAKAPAAPAAEAQVTRTTVTALQKIGLPMRSRPGAGSTVTTVPVGTDLTATCASTGPTTWGWHGVRSNLWARVTTDNGITGYAPVAWLQAPATLPTC